MMLALLLALAPQNPTFTPQVIDLSISPGQLQQQVVQVCLPGEFSVPLADVFILADSTGSMGSYIGQVQADAGVILGALLGDPNVDFQIGVGDYKDFPLDVYAFQLAQPITDDSAAITNAINGWSASGGSDWPEGQLYAIDQIAKDPAINWRPGAKRIILYFGDAPGHDPVCQAISGLSYDVTEAGFVDGNDDGLLGAEAPPQVDDDGLVTSGLLNDGYSDPLDRDSDGNKDFQQYGQNIVDAVINKTNLELLESEVGSFTIIASVPGGDLITYQ